MKKLRFLTNEFAIFENKTILNEIILHFNNFTQYVINKATPNPSGFFMLYS